jgi:hypothetical protein
VVDILKITSPISIKSKVQNLPSKLPTDAVFDIANTNQILTELPKTKGVDEESTQQSLLKNLNREIFEPLLTSTRSQADGVRKLVLMAKLFETSSGVLPESFLDKVFVRPQEMLGELLTRDKGATIFKGEFFDSLRMLAKLEGQPRLKEAVVSILKHFESYVHQDNSLNSIIKQGQDLARLLPKAEAQLLQQQIESLDTMVKLNNMTQSAMAAVVEVPVQDDAAEGNPLEGQPGALKQNLAKLENVIKQVGENQTEIKAYLKNEVIPLLGQVAKRHQGSDRIYNREMTIVHNIVRYDKADPRLLEEAVYQLGDELKQLTNLTSDDIIEMKTLIFEHARVERELGTKPESGADGKAAEESGTVQGRDKDIADLLSKALEKDGPSKVNSLAQNLLYNMVQNESPLMALMHFTIPFRYLDENTYGEFFVDKDCKEKRGDAKEAKNIFFTIQSDKYGNFEVDLLARDKRIDLDIRCPDSLMGSVKDTKSKLRDIIEEQGFRLASYQVGAYQEGQTILQKFPKLAVKKVGIDVKI